MPRMQSDPADSMRRFDARHWQGCAAPAVVAAGVSLACLQADKRVHRAARGCATQVAGQWVNVVLLGAVLVSSVSHVLP